MTACSPQSTELEERLGHTFKDKELLRRALTHASADAERSNERLEFLGDRVLGLVAAEKLHALYPQDSEGALALKFNALARREACARAAEAASLGTPLVRAISEAGSGRAKSALLAGVCEAVIAALYLDGGFEAARRFIDFYWADAFAELNADMRDPKTVLQEWAQGKSGKRGMPVYRLVKREGPDHAPRFVIEVSVKGEAPMIGEGGSKQEAELDAARKMLDGLNVR